MAKEEAAQTLVSLGMRKSSDLEIPYDFADAQLQQSAEDVDEHDSLYPARQPTTEEDTLVRQKPVLKRFFRQFAAPRLLTSRPSSGSEDGLATNNITNSSVQTNVSNNRYSSPILDLDNDDGAVGIGHETEAEEAANGIEEVGRTNMRRHVAALSLRSEDALGLEQLRHRSDDEESHISFVSEREVDEDKEMAVEYAAQKLFEQLQGGHHSCSEEDHAEKLREHMNKEGNNYYGLSDLFRNRRLPSVLGSENFITAAELEQRQLPTAARMGGHVLWHPSKWRSALTNERLSAQRADTRGHTGSRIRCRQLLGFLAVAGGGQEWSIILASTADAAKHPDGHPPRDECILIISRRR